MQQTLTYSILVTGAIVAAFAVALVMVGAVQLTARRNSGYMHLIFYAIVLMIAVGTLFSGRDLTIMALNADVPPPEVRNPVLAGLQRLVSLLLLTVSGERILSHWLRHEKTTFAPPALLTAFIIFWTGTVAMPALLGGNPFVSHDYAYTLVIGIGAVLANGIERDQAFRAVRNALMLFMAAGLLLIPFKHNLVIDAAYSQGFMPGVPRLAGLAVHAVSLGMLAQLGLLCLLTFPYQRRWLNLLAWTLGLVVLFMAQSKTAWICFMLSSLCIMIVRHGTRFWRRVDNPGRPEFGILFILIGMFLVLAVSLIVMFGDLDTRLTIFFNSSEGAQLASLTGRDKIWAIAYEEWQRYPVFGYGPTIWDEVFRKAIGMPNATHAHNQFMDTLSRSGSVGAAALMIYAVVLLVMSVRYARASKGLTLALFLALAIRSISEVPLSLFGYGEELLSHALLLIALGASASEVRIRELSSRRNDRRAASPHFRPASDSLINARFTP